MNNTKTYHRQAKHGTADSEKLMSFSEWRSPLDADPSLRNMVNSMTSRPEINVDHAKKISVAILHKFVGHPAFLQEESQSYIYTTIGDAWLCVCVRVCVFAKLDQFLHVRSQFDSNQHVNSVRIATFQSANFGPLLFAFYCPLFFYENKIKNE